MFGKNARGFGISLAILLFALYYTRNQAPFNTALVAVATVVVIIIVINRFVKGETREIFISGFLFGLPEAYVFLIQPNYPGLPELPGNVELFFGIAFLTRAILLLLEMLDTPVKNSVRKLVKA